MGGGSEARTIVPARPESGRSLHGRPRPASPIREMTSRTLLTLAVVLALLWILASVTRFIVGAALHLLLLGALVLLVLGLVRRVKAKL